MKLKTVINLFLLFYSLFIQKTLQKLSKTKQKSYSLRTFRGLPKFKAHLRDVGRQGQSQTLRMLTYVDVR